VELDVGGLQLAEFLGWNFNATSTNGTLAAWLITFPEISSILTEETMLYEIEPSL